MIAYETNQRLCIWDGAHISSYQTNQRIRRFDGQYLLAYDTNKRLLEIKGSVPIALIIALALGLL